MYSTSLGSIVFGTVAGWLTGKLVRGIGYGILTDLLLGLIGALIGGRIFSRFGIVSHGLLSSLAVATVGAVELLTLVRLVSR
jgi:uncharacterized membrane protein YeaQ/YmgE (transglycosylase-associated protein family)